MFFSPFLPPQKICARCRNLPSSTAKCLSGLPEINSRPRGSPFPSLLFRFTGALDPDDRVKRWFPFFPLFPDNGQRSASIDFCALFSEEVALESHHRTECGPTPFLFSQPGDRVKHHPPLLFFPGEIANFFYRGFFSPLGMTSTFTFLPLLWTS